MVFVGWTTLNLAGQEYPDFRPMVHTINYLELSAEWSGKGTRPAAVAASSSDCFAREEETRELDLEAGALEL